MSQTYSESNDNNSHRNHFAGRLTQFVVLVIFCLLVVGPLTIYGCRGEKAKWSTARAMVLVANGQHDAAIEKLRVASIESDHDPQITAGLANLLAENGRAAEGLEIITAAKETHPDSIELLHSKSNCEQHLNRPAEALVSLKSALEHLPKAVASSDGQLNNLAYYRALAGVEINNALTDMQAVIRNQARTASWPVGFDLHMLARTYVAIGMLSRKLHTRKQALEAIGREIRKLVNVEFRDDRVLSEAIYIAMQDKFPFQDTFEDDLTGDQRMRLDRQRDSLAFLLIIRALIHQDLGNESESEADRMRVLNLGYDAERILEKLPTDLQSLETLNVASTYLDTYGFVLLQMGELLSAQEYLDAATLSADLNLRALDSPLHNSSEELMFDAQQMKPPYQRTAAVLHYHRMKLFGRLQQIFANERFESEIVREARKIRELGFDPDSRLF